MYRLWLIFAQAATIAVAALFVVSTFRPEWLPSRPGSHVAVVQQAPTTGPLPTAVRVGSYHEAVQRAAPSVVNIFTSKEIRSPRHPLLNDPIFRRFFGEQLPDEAQRASSLGSGVIVSASGFVLTNHHVVEAADEIEVALADGKKLLAKVVGNDPETDLAVLRVNADNLPAITFGSSDALKVGDVVLAIGNPFGVGQTVTGGIVSALGRTGLGINTFENFIQTDAAINPGNSGGALIDAGGNLVGINTAIFSRSGGSMGIGFAIPVSTAKMVLEQIVKTGGVTRGWIGVEVQEITPGARRFVQARRPARRADRRRAARRPGRQGRHQARRRAGRSPGQAGRRPDRDAQPDRRARARRAGEDEAQAPGPGRRRDHQRRPPSQAAAAQRRIIGVRFAILFAR